MENFIDKTQDHIDLAADIIEDLRSAYPNLDQASNIIPLKKFNLLKDYVKVKPLQTVQIELANKTAFGSFVHVEYFVGLGRDGSTNSSELRVYVAVKLPKDFGHIFIKNETFAEKLRELFQPLETDIREDPEFSRRFYVLVKDQDKGMELLSKPFRSVLKSSKIKGLQIEISNDILVMGYAEDAEITEVIKLGIDISEIRY